MAHKKKRKTGVGDVRGLSWQRLLLMSALAAVVAVGLTAVESEYRIFVALAGFVQMAASIVALALLVSAAAIHVFSRYKQRKANPYARIKWNKELLFDMPRMGPQRMASGETGELTPTPPAASPEPPAQPQLWSPELLGELEWRRFELLCTAYYEMREFRVETTRRGTDGGVEAQLYFRQLSDPVAVLICKAWHDLPVGVEPVRELLALMEEHKVRKGIFHATGDYTGEAREFAASHKIQLIRGADLIGNMAALPEAAGQKLHAIATEGDYRTPSCPSCTAKMKVVSGAAGDFWGCSNFPRCRTRLIAPQIPG